MSGQFGDPIDGTKKQGADQYKAPPRKALQTNAIAQHIGEGDNAKDSVVWFVITKIFYIYSIIILILLINDICRFSGVNCLNIIHDTWATYSPILTLSLGYMFGRKEKKGKAESV